MVRLGWWGAGLMGLRVGVQSTVLVPWLLVSNYQQLYYIVLSTMGRLVGSAYSWLY